MKKIGLICLALVVAMGAIGVGYAHWSDTVTITQVVQTGSLKVGVFGVATDPAEVEEKDVAKVAVKNGYTTPYIGGPITPGENDNPDFIKMVEESDLHTASLVPAGEYPFYPSTTIEISNMYPCITILEDFYIGVGGTIPVKLIVGVEIVDPMGVYDNMTVNWMLDHNGVVLGSGGGILSEQLPRIVALMEGEQMHGCDIMCLWWDKHLEQSAPQGEKASFTIKVEGMQWNLYGVP